MEFPEDLLYTRDHEWARYDAKKKVVTIGITDFAQSKLGDIVHVELPEEGDDVKVEEPFGSVESVKAVEDIFSPISGEVLEVNTVLMDSPEIVNEDASGEGWMVRVKISDDSALDEMMSAEAYQEFVESEDA